MFNFVRINGLNNRCTRAQAPLSSAVKPFLKTNNNEEKINKRASERASRRDNMSNCYDHELKMNMLDTYYFKNKKQVVKMLNESKAELTNWFFDEMQKYENAEKNLDQWFTEYTGQSFNEMLKEQKG